MGILKYGFNLDYSADGRFMAMGNDEGKVHLWSIGL